MDESEVVGVGRRDGGRRQPDFPLRRQQRLYKVPYRRQHRRKYGRQCAGGWVEGVDGDDGDDDDDVI